MNHYEKQKCTLGGGLGGWGGDACYEQKCTLGGGWGLGRGWGLELRASDAPEGKL